MDEAFFKQAFEADAANQKHQSWKEYHEWVHTFYHGKRFPPVAGWKEREKEILARLHESHHGRVHERLSHVGKVLAAEWSKDNRVRKVSTSDLQAWGARFKDAAKDADALLAALQAVEAEVAGRASR